ncbi:hypothetical protein PybrP1_013121 [[Pythium] brassicae (nom. inval.)]|nr:hypothetical protein PybrP1_013121 [[Pythium] brassicae (nom. inval.)]
MFVDPNWPKQSHNLVLSTARVKTRVKKLVFSELKLRMGIHDTQAVDNALLVASDHRVTHKITYTGLAEVIANEVGDVSVGGYDLRHYAHRGVGVPGREVAHEAECVGAHLIPQLNLI